MLSYATPFKTTCSMWSNFDDPYDRPVIALIILTPLTIAVDCLVFPFVLLYNTFTLCYNVKHYDTNEKKRKGSILRYTDIYNAF